MKLSDNKVRYCEIARKFEKNYDFFMFTHQLQIVLAFS